MPSNLASLFVGFINLETLAFWDGVLRDEDSLESRAEKRLSVLRLSI
jgi:hypothetical protein